MHSHIVFIYAREATLLFRKPTPELLFRFEKHFSSTANLKTFASTYVHFSWDLIGLKSSIVGASLKMNVLTTK